jgi:hypothetical protein
MNGPPRWRESRWFGAAEEGATQVIRASGSTLDLIEERRLRAVLSWRRGERHRGVVHLDWLYLVFPFLGVAASFTVIATLPLAASVPVLAIAHGFVVSRRVPDRWSGGAVAGSELISALAIWQVAGVEALAVVMVTYVAAWSVLAVIGWRVDMLVTTTHRRLLRTRGLFLLKRTTPVPLDSVRAAPFIGPFLNRGAVSVDSVSTEDKLLHDFGPVRDPSEVSAWALRERDWALGRIADPLEASLEE